MKETDMEITPIRTPGLGDATYLLSHDGLGVIVDPQRDIERFQAAAAVAGARVRYVLETHLHNDYVSGGRALARETGAELVLPAAAVVAFDHTPAFHGEEFGEGGLVIRPLHTPGHTPEHTSYLVLIDGQPVAVFSGGSLLVGAAGRSDLLGEERAYQLALAQYRSVRRLAALPESTGLYPTHGEGSFCTAGGAGRTVSTIGLEKQSNRVLHYPDGRAFAEGELTGLAPYPRYYAQMGPINLMGPTPLPDPSVPELSPAEMQALGDDVRIVDGRPRTAFAAGHIPGALGIELGAELGVWAGWVLPFNAPLVLVLDEDQDAREAVTQLGRIGFDRVRGVLRGVSGWGDAGLPLATYETRNPDEFAQAVRRGEARPLLDVRAPSEWEAGHLPGSLHRYVPDLVTAGVPAEIAPGERVWVACASGFRATIAAGLLERLGYRPVVLSTGGVPDLLARLRPAAALRGNS
jgi:glyoxylase-like metal-dependent hydrolase (beta-lactamase superfamily II)/rhodanese-related sulfurtransferase